MFTVGWGRTGAESGCV